MIRARHLIVLLLLALALAPVTATAAAGWDPQPLTLAGPLYESPRSGPVVETTDDGAVWVAWLAYDGTTAQTSVVVRRISPEGVPGEPRVLDPGNFTFQSGMVALAPLPGGDVRVAYPVQDAGEIGLRTRRLSPDSTGPEVPLLTATAGDGLHADSVKLLAAPGSAVWAVFGHGSSMSTTLTAVRIADTGTLSPAFDAATDLASYDAAAAPDGKLVLLAAPATAPGRVDVIRASVQATLNGSAEVRPVQAGKLIGNPAIAIDGDGFATATWRLVPSVTGSPIVEARRISAVDLVALTPLGSVTRLDGTPAEGPAQPGPFVAADPGGGVLAGWPQQTLSANAFTDSYLRPLPAAPLTTTAGLPALASVSALTGAAANLSDLVPGGDGTFTAHAYVQAQNNDGNLTACRAVRLTSGGGLIDDHTLAATGCTLSTGPVSAVNGNAAVWTTVDDVIRVSRLVTSAPACDPVTAVTVQAGASVTVPLACGGWRPVRAITAQPARGTLGAIDDGAATVTYTAGTAPGPDTFTFRAANGAGAGDEVTVPITVTPRPLPPSPPAAGQSPAPDTTAPVITKLSLTPRLVVRTAPRTPTLRFTLSEPASVTITLERTSTGRRVGGRCIPGRAKKAGARCLRTVTVSTAVRQAPAGAAKLAIAVGKGRRVLAAGSYRVSVSPRDAAGNAGAAQRAVLVIAAR